VRGVGMSRGAIRQLMISDAGNTTLRSLDELATFFDREIEVLLTPQSILAEFSTIASALKVERDGFPSWKIHFLDLVDEFRRTLDPRLILLPPHEKLNPRLRALLASIVRDLTMQSGMSTPAWATRKYFLEKPWFVSEMNSLKASALVESPLAYRANNIFVHNNFLSRA